MKSPNTIDDALWKRRFRQPRIIKSDVAAANPNRGLVCSNKSGKYQLYAWDVPAGQLQQLTDKEAGVMFGEIDPQGAYVYYLDDQKGDELGHIVRVPFAGGEPQDLTSDFPPYSDRGMAIDYENQHLVLCLTNENGFHLYGLSLEDNGDTISTLRLLQQTEAFAVMPSINRDGDLVVWHLSQAQKLKYKLSVISWETGEVVAELSDGLDHSLLVIRFSPLLNDARILGKSNRSGYERPFIWNPLTNERVDLPFPEFEGDMVPLDWSGNGRLLLLSHVFQAQQQLYLYDFAQQNLIRLNHPQGVFDSEAGSYFSPDGSIYCGWQDATHPLCLIELDGQTGQKRGTLLAAGDSLPGQSWESITFPSTNERSIQAWMALPDPPEEGPYPTILHMVGGPGGVMRASYSANAQMWLDHGFAFVSVNYRGCSTFGQEFKDEIIGDLGHWEVDDMVAATQWLVQQGIAQSDRILLLGWSYGGYLSLMGLGTQPMLWAGAMTSVAIVDWLGMYEDIVEAFKPLIVHYLGGTPEELPEQYARSSPITYVEQVQAPVLIIQGMNDGRLPSRSIKLYEEKMKAHGKSIEVDWFDAGHMGVGIEQEIEHAERMLRFAYRVLNG